MADQADKVIDYRNVFNTEAGRKVLYDLMNIHNFLTPTYDHKDKNSLSMAYKEGERNVILRILTLMEMDPYKIREQMKEGREKDGYYDTESTII